MDESDALATLAALAQPTRLAVFRLLVTREPLGLPAGDIATSLAVPQNTMSTHLGVLARAGLVCAERHSRSMIYRARLDALRALMVFLARDCCNAHPELCTPLLAELACCPPTKVKA
ncbi:metalloregulator ArsR/SmtB family transcription factor [Dyella sp.]|jgi:DNA-binding transcriptional ArsR family regulator|uniref:ArsR/SmtB family transcription factor n=1 Tax=Dyella sp. TaxID=1869338 RepID=UPI002D78ED12|nr:metalloregulator ArsR/SmtB family transcription factor [Dyella sp.]HET6432066.1 metalloregulator ArsR/SmtB family transcription factor [Dyella sp.]